MSERNYQQFETPVGADALSGEALSTAFEVSRAFDLLEVDQPATNWEPSVIGSGFVSESPDTYEWAAGVARRSLQEMVAEPGSYTIPRALTLPKGEDESDGSFWGRQGNHLQGVITMFDYQAALRRRDTPEPADVYEAADRLGAAIGRQDDLAADSAHSQLQHAAVPKRTKWWMPKQRQEIKLSEDISARTESSKIETAATVEGMFDLLSRQYEDSEQDFVFPSSWLYDRNDDEAIAQHDTEVAAKLNQIEVATAIYELESAEWLESIKESSQQHSQGLSSQGIIKSFFTRSRQEPVESPGDGGSTVRKSILRRAIAGLATASGFASLPARSYKTQSQQNLSENSPAQRYLQAIDSIRSGTPQLLYDPRADEIIGDSAQWTVDHQLFAEILGKIPDPNKTQRRNADNN